MDPRRQTAAEGKVGSLTVPNRVQSVTTRHIFDRCEQAPGMTEDARPWCQLDCRLRAGEPRARDGEADGEGFAHGASHVAPAASAASMADNHRSAGAFRKQR